MAVVTMGIVLNAVVIGLNLGMPTRAVGLDDQGHRVREPITQSVKHRPANSDDLLGFLGDKILLPEPSDELISIGDIVLLIGVAAVAYFGSRKHERRQSRLGVEQRRDEER